MPSQRTRLGADLYPALLLMSSLPCRSVGRTASHHCISLLSNSSASVSRTHTLTFQNLHNKLQPRLRLYRRVHNPLHSRHPSFRIQRRLIHKWLRVPVRQLLARDDSAHSVGQAQIVRICITYTHKALEWEHEARLGLCNSR